jgi:hypothetical protein
MAYSVGGTIEASDFNIRNGSTTANVSGQINSVYATGNGNSGYGQTSLVAGNVSVGNNISAGSDPGLGPVLPSQWRSMILALNICRNHQTGSSSGITAPGYGDTISYYSTLDTQLTSAYTDRLTAAATGSTTTGTNDTWNISVGATTALGAFRDCNVVFSSADAARYFFNAGGRIAMIYSAVDNASTTRSQSVRDLVNQIGGFNTYRGYSNSGITGTGGSYSINNTGVGYWSTTGSATTFIQNNDSAPYSGYNARVQHFTAGSTTNGSKGEQLVFRLILFAFADDIYGGSINITVTSRCDITFPSTTHLSDSWGTPTISYDSL